MTRMKNCWDEIHPEYSFLTSKLLRDQASRVVKNKVMATEYKNDQDTNTVLPQDNEVLIEQQPQEPMLNILTYVVT